MPGFSLLYSSIFFSTSGVVTCFKRTGRQALVPSTLGQMWGPYGFQTQRDALSCTLGGKAPCQQKDPNSLKKFIFRKK